MNGMTSGLYGCEMNRRYHHHPDGLMGSSYYPRKGEPIPTEISDLFDEIRKEVLKHPGSSIYLED
jgi:hypothetical protein